MRARIVRMGTWFELAEPTELAAARGLRARCLGLDALPVPLPRGAGPQPVSGGWFSAIHTAVCVAAGTTRAVIHGVQSSGIGSRRSEARIRYTLSRRS